MIAVQLSAVCLGRVVLKKDIQTCNRGGKSGSRHQKDREPDGCKMRNGRTDRQKRSERGGARQMYPQIREPFDAAKYRRKRGCRRRTSQDRRQQGPYVGIAERQRIEIGISFSNAPAFRAEYEHGRVRKRFQHDRRSRRRACSREERPPLERDPRPFLQDGRRRRTSGRFRPS